MPQLSRRHFLQGATATGALACLSTRAIASRQIGSATITSISDGHLVLPRAFAIGPAPQAEADAIFAAHNLTAATVEPRCNVTLYQDGTNTVLFDVGAGPDFMPTAGQLLDSLAAANVAPEDVTHVCFTHAHPDHLWGLIDDFDEPVFANARHLMGRTEWDYWWAEDTINTIGESRQLFAAGARRRLQMTEDLFEHFNDGDEVISGIAAVATHGHTPGHMSFEVRAGSDALLIIGDAIANHHIAFAHPDWAGGSDQIPDQAIASRRALFDRITADDLAVLGFHFPGSGMGRVSRSAQGFVFEETAT